MPVLFLSGEQDELIPPHMMSTLFAACSSEIKGIERFPQGVPSPPLDSLLPITIGTPVQTATSAPNPTPPHSVPPPGKHNSTWQSSFYYQSIIHFLNHAVPFGHERAPSFDAGENGQLRHTPPDHGHVRHESSGSASTSSSGEDLSIVVHSDRHEAV